MDKRPIGIFDSGVGGITVLKEIKNKMPNENIVYLGDTQNFPYGNKSKEEIIRFSIENVNKLIKKDVKIIVIACGTATSQAIDVLKGKFNIPIMGIIEPTVEYIKNMKYKKVGVIATEGTIKNDAFLPVLYELDKTEEASSEENDESDEGVWRTPNLNELMVMSTVNDVLDLNVVSNGRDETKVNVFSRTRFSNDAVRPGFYLNYSDMITVNGENEWATDGNQYPTGDIGGSGYVRCVRDATAEDLQAATSY